MNKLFEMKFGSHLYGTNTPASDLDLKSIYIPSAAEILLGRAKDTIVTARPKAEFERNTKDDVDLEIFSLERYLTLLCQGQTVALDMLFAPESFISYSRDDGRRLWKEIRSNRGSFLHRNISPFIGYARQQAAKYGVKGSRLEVLNRAIELFSRCTNIHAALYTYMDVITELLNHTEQFVSLERKPLVEIQKLLGPNRKDYEPYLSICDRKFALTVSVKTTLEILRKIQEGYGLRAKKAHLAGGVDWKALSHAVRVNSQGLELLRTGNITFPRPDRELLLQIKTGQKTFDEVSEIITNGLLELEEAQETSELPEMPDYHAVDALICQEYGAVVGRSPWVYAPPVRSEPIESYPPSEFGDV